MNSIIRNINLLKIPFRLSRKFTRTYLIEHIVNSPKKAQNKILHVQSFPQISSIKYFEPVCEKYMNKFYKCYNTLNYTENRLVLPQLLSKLTYTANYKSRRDFGRKYIKKNKKDDTKLKQADTSRERLRRDDICDDACINKREEKVKKKKSNEKEVWDLKSVVNLNNVLEEENKEKHLRHVHGRNKINNFIYKPNICKNCQQKDKRKQEKFEKIAKLGQQKRSYCSYSVIKKMYPRYEVKKRKFKKIDYEESVTPNKEKPYHYCINKINHKMPLKNKSKIVVKKLQTEEKKETATPLYLLVKEISAKSRTENVLKNHKGYSNSTIINDTGFNTQCGLENDLYHKDKNTCQVVKSDLDLIMKKTDQESNLHPRNRSLNTLMKKKSSKVHDDYLKNNGAQMVKGKESFLNKSESSTNSRKILFYSLDPKEKERVCEDSKEDIAQAIRQILKPVIEQDYLKYNEVKTAIERLEQNMHMYFKQHRNLGLSQKENIYKSATNFFRVNDYRNNLNIFDKIEKEIQDPCTKLEIKDPLRSNHDKKEPHKNINIVVPSLKNEEILDPNEHIVKIVKGSKYKNFRYLASSCKEGDPCKKDSCKKDDPCKKDSCKKEDPCKKEDQCMKKNTKKEDAYCKKGSSCKSNDPFKKDPRQKKSPCKMSCDDPCKKEDACKKGDPCKKKDPCKKDDPCKMDDPCKKKDPCKKEEPCMPDPCKKDPCKKDPCKQKDPCKKEDPCKKDPCKKEDPCKKKHPCKKEEPCKPDPCKKDPCKKDPCPPADPCKKDPCKKDPCKKEDPCKKSSPCSKPMGASEVTCKKIECVKKRPCCEEVKVCNEPKLPTIEPKCPGAMPKNQKREVKGETVDYCKNIPMPEDCPMKQQGIHTPPAGKPASCTQRSCTAKSYEPTEPPNCCKPRPKPKPPCSCPRGPGPKAIPVIEKSGPPKRQSPCSVETKKVKCENKEEKMEVWGLANQPCEKEPPPKKKCPAPTKQDIRYCTKQTKKESVIEKLKPAKPIPCDARVPPKPPPRIPASQQWMKKTWVPVKIKAQKPTKLKHASSCPGIHKPPQQPKLNATLPKIEEQKKGFLDGCKGLFSSVCKVFCPGKKGSGKKGAAVVGAATSQSMPELRTRNENFLNCNSSGASGGRKPKKKGGYIRKITVNIRDKYPWKPVRPAGVKDNHHSFSRVAKQLKEIKETDNAYELKKDENYDDEANTFAPINTNKHKNKSEKPKHLTIKLTENRTLWKRSNKNKKRKKRKPYESAESAAKYYGQHYKSVEAEKGTKYSYCCSLKEYVRPTGSSIRDSYPWKKEASFDDPNNECFITNISRKKENEYKNNTDKTKLMANRFPKGAALGEEFLRATEEEMKMCKDYSPKEYTCDKGFMNSQTLNINALLFKENDKVMKLCSNVKTEKLKEIEPHYTQISAMSTDAKSGDKSGGRKDPCDIKDDRRRKKECVEEDRNLMKQCMKLCGKEKSKTKEVPFNEKDENNNVDCFGQDLLMCNVKTLGKCGEKLVCKPVPKPKPLSELNKVKKEKRDEDVERILKCKMVRDECNREVLICKRVKATDEEECKDQCKKETEEQLSKIFKQRNYQEIHQKPKSMIISKKLVCKPDGNEEMICNITEVKEIQSGEKTVPKCKKLKEMQSAPYTYKELLQKSEEVRKANEEKISKGSNKEKDDEKKHCRKPK